MTNEPTAGTRIDPETLAAYLEQRLSPAQRAAVEAQVAADPDSYAVLVESMRALDEMAEAEPRPARIVPFAPRRTNLPRRVMIAALGMAAAAALAVVILQPVWIQRATGDDYEPRFDRLVAAVGEQRYIEPRLSGGFRYAPMPRAARGSNRALNFALMTAAGELEKSAQADRSTANLHALGVANLQLQDLDAAIAALESAAALSNSASILSDLAAAYAMRAMRAQQAEDWSRAIATIDRALSLDDELPEALFNRAWILEGQSRRPEAIDAWRAYLERDGTSPWAGEAKQRLALLENPR